MNGKDAFFDLVPDMGQEVEEPLGDELTELSEEAIEEASEPERDLLQHYINEASRIPLLDPEETRRYLLQFQSGNEAEGNEAHAILVEHNLRLVIKIALNFQKYWRRSGLDLIQEGNIGLMNAIKKFDPNRGVKLSYYASFWIKAYVMKFIMDNWHQVKLGTTQTQRMLFYNLKREKEKLRLQGFDPDTEIIASSLGVSKAAVEEMEQRMASRGLSLSDTLKEDSESERGDFLTDEGPNQLETLTNVEERRNILEKLAKLRKHLNDREIFILDQRILAEKPARLQIIGSHFEISRERVRQIEARLIEKINIFLHKGVLPVKYRKNGDNCEVPSSESFLSLIGPADADSRTFFADYIESVSLIEPLTAREEKIALELRRKNDTSCDVLTEANLQLVVDIVLEFASSGKRKLTADDLFFLLKQGNKTLSGVVRRYKNKDGEFQVFIATEIRQEILSCISALALAKKCWTKKFITTANRILGSEISKLNHYLQLAKTFRDSPESQRKIISSRSDQSYDERKFEISSLQVQRATKRFMNRLQKYISQGDDFTTLSGSIFSVSLIIAVGEASPLAKTAARQNWVASILNLDLSSDKEILTRLRNVSLKKIRKAIGSLGWRIFSPLDILPLCRKDCSLPEAFTEKQARRFFLLFGNDDLDPREIRQAFGLNNPCHAIRARHLTVESVSRKIKSYFNWGGGHVLFPENQLSFSFWPEWEQSNLPLLCSSSPRILSTDLSPSKAMFNLALKLLNNPFFLADLKGGTSPEILGLFLDRLGVRISGKDKVRMLRLIYGKKGASRLSYSALSREMGYSAPTVKNWWSGILDEIRDFILRKLKEQQ